ncbi:hypothetical protein DP42_5947 [Burkholderia pseudomallei]|nr:hypothetical protein DP42_5947 [Burkholderia pseudomallei]
MRDVAALEFRFEPADGRRAGERAHEPPLVAPLDVGDHAADPLERRRVVREFAGEARMRGIVAADQLDGSHVADERCAHQQPGRDAREEPRGEREAPQHEPRAARPLDGQPRVALARQHAREQVVQEQARIAGRARRRGVEPVGQRQRRRAARLPAAREQQPAQIRCFLIDVRAERRARERLERGPQAREFVRQHQRARRRRLAARRQRDAQRAEPCVEAVERARDERIRVVIAEIAERALALFRRELRGPFVEAVEPVALRDEHVHRKAPVEQADQLLEPFANGAAFDRQRIAVRFDEARRVDRDHDAVHAPARTRAAELLEERVPCAAIVVGRAGRGEAAREIEHDRVVEAPPVAVLGRRDGRVVARVPQRRHEARARERGCLARALGADHEIPRQRVARPAAQARRGLRAPERGERGAPARGDAQLRRIGRGQVLGRVEPCELRACTNRAQRAARDAAQQPSGERRAEHGGRAPQRPVEIERARPTERGEREQRGDPRDHHAESLHCSLGYTASTIRTMTT